MVFLVLTEGTVVLWQQFRDLALDPIVHRLQSSISGASVHCSGHIDSWSAAIALESSEILLLRPEWSLSALQTLSLGPLSKSQEVPSATYVQPTDAFVIVCMP